MTAADAIVSIVINLFSSLIYDGKATIREKFKLWKFRRKLLKWTRQYINNHDGTVLTSGDFETFLQSYHVIENIFKQVSGADSSVSKENFIHEQINLFHSVQKHPEKNRFDTDNVLYDFLSYYYGEIDSFFRKNLSQNEKYIVARSNEGTNRVIDAIQKEERLELAEFDEIKKLLQNPLELNDPELIWSIYQTLSASLLDGKITEVLHVYPLLKGKSKDLEISISFLLGLLSDQKSDICDFSAAQAAIEDIRIYNHVCTYAIYISDWRKSLKNLDGVSDRNPEMKSIIQSLLTGKHEDFYTIEKSEQDGFICFTYRVENKYPNEQWLVKRICMLDLLQQPVFNAYDSIKQLIEKPDNILDSIILLDRRITESYNKIEISKEMAKDLYDTARKLVETSINLSIDIQTIIYALLLRSALLVSTEASEKALTEVPNALYGIKDIDFLMLQVKLKKSEATVEEVINCCMKRDEYWLFNNYLVDHIEIYPSEMKALIEKYSFTIERDASVFLLYAQLVNNIDGKDGAIELMEKYRSQYGEYVEFWIDKLRINYSEEELNYVITEYDAGNLKHLSNGGSLALVKLLVQRNRYADALKIINRHEKAGNITDDYVRIKAIALCNTKHEIESLAIFMRLFQCGYHDEQIVYYILALSVNNRRQVPQEVLVCAEASEDLQILIATTSVYAIENDAENALKLNMKAMLRTTDEKSQVFNQRLGIETLEDHSEEIIVKCIDINTVAKLCGIEDQIEKVYAIHSIQLLPREPYEWGNATHIYKESAITLGLLRKKVGDEVVIDSRKYKVAEIIPLSTYFFRLSMANVVKNGQAKMISIPLTEGDGLDIDAFTKIVKETIGDDKSKNTWLDQYKDLNQIPITFFFSKRFVRGTYFQLVCDIFRNKSILYREENSIFAKGQENYVLSYAALVVLYILGWTGAKDNITYAIPSVLKKVIAEEEDTVIRENNREHVSFMGINDDKLYVVENTEEDKKNFMQQAVELKKYSDGYLTLENDADIHIDSDQDFDIKEVLGIVDYDAISVAKQTGRALVSAEMMVSAICHMPEINVQTVGIADFLANEVNDVYELLGYVRKMIEYKCTIPFSVNTINRLLNAFENSNVEDKKKIIDEWSAILKLPMEDEKYRNEMLLHVQECIRQMKEEDRFKPIGELLLYSWVNYSGQKIVLTINENGEFITQLVKAE